VPRALLRRVWLDVTPRISATACPQRHDVERYSRYKGLREKLKGELPGILNRAIQGLKRLNLNEAFTQPKSVVEAKKAYIRSNDNLRVFAEECLIANPIGTITKKEFYEVYANWCESYGDRPVTQKLLKDALKQIFPNLDEWREDKTSPRCWLGFEWSDDAASYKPVSFSVGGKPTFQRI
jgi:phage/plasmid-associated DNA primase